MYFGIVSWSFENQIVNFNAESKYEMIGRFLYNKIYIFEDLLKRVISYNNNIFQNI